MIFDSANCGTIRITKKTTKIYVDLFPEEEAEEESTEIAEVEHFPFTCKVRTAK